MTFHNSADIDLSTINTWQNENYSDSICECDDDNGISKLQWYGISSTIMFKFWQNGNYSDFISDDEDSISRL